MELLRPFVGDCAYGNVAASQHIGAADLVYLLHPAVIVVVEQVETLSGPQREHRQP